MDKMWRAPILFAMVVVLAAACYGLYLQAQDAFDPQRMAYDGSNAFFTEEDYTDFKLAITRDDVTIRDIEVLSSESPIVVAYRVHVDADLGFPYGQADYHPAQERALVAFFSFLTLVVFVMGYGIALSHMYPKEKK